MRRIIFITTIIFFCIFINIVFPAAQEDSPLPFHKGESLSYEVRYKGLGIGESVMSFHGEKKLNGEDTYYVTFSTNIPSFRDREEIYADKKTFLPLEVYRAIKKSFGFNDRIREKYDQENYKVYIKQKSNLRTRTFIIEKESPIHNAILLTYLYRARKDFNKGEEFSITLPTVDFNFVYIGIESIRTPLGEYRAHAFTSRPPRFKLWLSADERKIPLKIEKPGRLDYSLIIRSIK